MCVFPKLGFIFARRVFVPNATNVVLIDPSNASAPLWQSFYGRWGGKLDASFSSVKCYNSQHPFAPAGECNSTRAIRLIDTIIGVLGKIPTVINNQIFVWHFFLDPFFF